jgi:hypothetical protein
MCGGSFGGQLDAGTVERLVNAHFAVTVKPSGRACFVDRQGREVSLYVSVDAWETPPGKKALALWRANAARTEEVRAAAEEARCEELAEAMIGLPYCEILKRLRAL